jgi:hypothetical protein
MVGIAFLTVLSQWESPTRADLIVGSTPYLSFTDSPFASLGVLVDDFESGAFVLPGVSVNAGWAILTPGALTDSVDGDDGAIDGSGTAGHSLYSGGNSSLVVTFDASTFGGLLPKVAGIAWTDVGSVSSGTFGFGTVTLEAFDASNNSIGSVTSGLLGDGSVAGGTAEDRFFGVVFAGGISRFVLTMNSSTDWEVDHLQFGFQAPNVAVVPEPSTLALAAIGLGVAGLVAIRPRRLAPNPD